MVAPIQTEFLMRVPVCAWCRPKELGTGLGAISHGICLRHFQQIKLECQGIGSRRSPRRRRVPKDHALLPF